MNIADARQLFPITKEFINLNNAAESPMNTLVKEKLNEYLTYSENYPHKKPEARTEVRSSLSKLFGGEPNDYSLVTSTGHGIGIIASGYKWQSGDNIVLPQREHWNNSFPWILQESKGVEVRFIRIKDDNRIDYDHLVELVDENTKIISIAAVRFNSGLRVDLKKIGELARKFNALFVVDGIQGTGALPINVIDDNIDVLAAAGFKWLLGLPGTGFLYANERARMQIEPVIPGMFAGEVSYDQLNFHSNTKKYETGTIAYPLFYSWTAGLNLLLELGIENIYNKILHLTDVLIDGLLAKNIEILSPIDSVSERSGIIICSAGSKEENYRLYQKLLENKIVVTYREGVIRISPNFYNTVDEIKTAVSYF